MGAKLSFWKFLLAELKCSTKREIAKNRGKLKTHHTDNEVTNILMLLSNSMVLRLELVLRSLALHVREAGKGKKELPEVTRYIKRINKLIIRGM